MPRANWNVLKEYAIPIAPPDLQKRFQRLMAGLVATVQNYVMRNRNLRATRDLLLPKLISGELDAASLPKLEAAVA
jgi:type I restriction enzyme S subunit